MKIETILNALLKAAKDCDYWREYDPWNADRRSRQVVAFRDRIIRMDEEKDEEIAKQKYKKEAWHEAYNNLFFHRKRGSQ